MEKPAETNTPIHDSLARRWSPRAFSERPVEREKLLSVLEAARWAPSSRNEQPWAYLLAAREDIANFDALLGVLVDSNRVWAQKAPILILTVAHTRWQKEGTPNRVGIYDLGQATTNLVVQATSLGLSTHQMGGFNVEAARARFHVPEGWEPVTVVALGYSADPETLPEALRGREIEKRRRKPLEEFVFSGTWGIPSPLLESNGNK
ncbi:MAG: nitroreductase family protein [Acidobacteriia bacterium]|nr:nitroreductase family protein [Terriglobia bacterium]